MNESTLAALDFRLRLPSALSLSLCLLLASGFAACSSDGGSGDQPVLPDGGGGIDAGDRTGDAGSGDAGSSDAGPDSDAGQPLPTFVSNTPRAVVRDVSSPAHPKLLLASSNLLQQSGTPSKQRWLGVLYNAGTETVCSVHVTAAFLDGAGAELAKFASYIHAATYESSLSSPIVCLAPGASGVVDILTEGAPEVGLSSVATIAVNIEPGSDPGAVPHPSAPAVTSELLSVTATSKIIAGTLVGSGTKDVQNVGLAIYPTDDRGLVLRPAYLATFLPNPVKPGQSVKFETSPFEDNASKYHIFAEFTE